MEIKREKEILKSINLRSCDKIERLKNIEIYNAKNASFSDTVALYKKTPKNKQYFSTDLTFMQKCQEVFFFHAMSRSLCVVICRSDSKT